MKITTIIATRNEASNIDRILVSLARQTYRDFEVIVIDNGSTDETIKIAKKADPRARILTLPNEIGRNVSNYRGAQVNYGVSLSAGDVIFFPDADMTFDADLLTKAAEQMEQFRALYVPEVVLGRGLFGKLRNFERSFYDGTVIDAPRFVEKKLFLQCGGFDQKNIAFGPDDWDLSMKISDITDKIGVCERSLYHHEEKLDALTYLRKKRNNYFQTFAAYQNKWKDRPELRKQFGGTYRLFTVFVEKGKWKKLIRAPHMAIMMLILKLAVAMSFLIWRAGGK